jgi:2,4-dienoyl-CoA reductase-like NADH-dependent reductase (Old Yellow Enzyme family)
MLCHTCGEKQVSCRALHSHVTVLNPNRFGTDSGRSSAPSLNPSPMSNSHGKSQNSVVIAGRSRSAAPVSSQSALQPVALPSGHVMSNGLVKAAMYEHMASLWGGLPNANHLELYTLWSQGGWGMVVTGNVQVSKDHLSLGRDMIIPRTVTTDTLRSYKALASAMRPVSAQFSSTSQDTSTPRTLIIMQLSHAGRQSPLVLGGRLPLVPPLAPSAVGLGRSEHPSSHMGWFAKLTYKIGFPTPRAMTLQDIDYTVNRFVLGAKLAHDSGFDGVELHASHGCECIPVHLHAGKN